VIQYSIAKEKNTPIRRRCSRSDLIERQQIGSCLQYVSLIVDSWCRCDTSNSAEG